MTKINPILFLITISCWMVSLLLLKIGYSLELLSEIAYKIAYSIVFLLQAMNFVTTLSKNELTIFLQKEVTFQDYLKFTTVILLCGVIFGITNQ